MKNGSVNGLTITCQNESCKDFGQLTGRVRRYGRTRKGIQRYQCKQCGSTFTQTKGSFFYNLHTSRNTILDCFQLAAAGATLAEIKQRQGVKEDTVIAWLRTATDYMEEINPLLQARHNLSETQLESLWALAAQKLSGAADDPK